MFAADVVRYIGEPIAAVVADDEEICARAIDAIEVTYEVLPALADARLAKDPNTPSIHPDGNVIREQNVITGDVSVVGDVVVEEHYSIGMQDQAFLGLESALAIPDEDGAGVECHVATQWLHEDLGQVAACLDLPESAVRLVLGGVGGAFGGREDLSLQVHVCLCVSHGTPVKMHYSRRKASLGTSIDTRQRFGCVTMPQAKAFSSKSKPNLSSTAVPTHRHHRLCLSMQ